MADWGMKISKEGFDVKTCTDDQLVFSSKLNTLKTKTTGSINAYGIQSIAHGLAYKPIFLTTSKVGEGKYSLATDSWNQTGVDSTYLYTGYEWSTNIMRYYIFFQEVF